MTLEKCSQPSRVPTWVEVWPQVFAGLAVTLTNCQTGIFLAHSGVLLPQLADDTDIQGFDRDAASWIAGIYSISSIFGALAGPVMDIIGRKKTLLLSQIPLLIHWIIMCTTYYSVWPIYIARTLAGIGSGLMCVALYVYLSEIANSHYRDPLSIMVGVSSTIGILLTSAIGAALDWHLASIIFGLINLSNVLIFFFIPESPYWMACFDKGSPEEIKKELRFLNRPEWLFQQAWSEIQIVMKSRAAEMRQSPTKIFEAIGEFVSIVKAKTTFIPLALVAILLAFQQLSGVYLFISYSKSIVASLGTTTIIGVDISIDGVIILMGILRVITTIASAIMSRIWSKNTIMMASGLATSLSAASVAVFTSLNGIADLNLKSNVADLPPSPNEMNSLAAMLSLFIFVGAGGFGLLAIPWTLASDLFSTNVRAIGNTFSIVVGYLMIFFTVKTFPYWLDAIELPVAFGIVSVSMIAFIVFVWFFIPDTSNKSFEEITATFLNYGWSNKASNTKLKKNIFSSSA